MREVTSTVATDINLPQLGESVTEGTITKWLVKPGDRVRRYDPIAEVVTDKVNTEIPAPADGVIVGLEVPEGVSIQVGSVIARMDLADASAAPAPTAAPVAAEVPAQSAGGAARVAIAAEAAAPAWAAVRANAATDGGGLPGGRFSPAVMKLAREHNVDLNRVPGTGLGGRITRKDVEAFVARRGTTTGVPAASTAAPVMAAPAVVGTVIPGQAAAGVAVPVPPDPPAAMPAAAPAAVTGADQVVPLTPVRRRIADKMLQAKREQPHAWTMVRVDVTGLSRLRDQMQAEFKAREGISLSYLPFVIRAVTESLREYPIMNSTWAGDHILIRRDLNISVAVATADALAVPVIRNADRLSITGLAHAVHEVAGRARTGRLSLDDIQGGTFTVNNTGSFGSVLSQPIINYPQAAILSLEAVVKEPVVLENDAIAIRHMVNLCCSLDHRILDGLVVGRFLQSVKRRLEAFAPGQTL